MSQQAPAIRIEPIKTLEGFDACASLQDIVWGYEASDRVSEKVYLLAAHTGGQVIGAYLGDKLIGYSMSLPGYRNGKSYLHSHHLAVLPEHRNLGLGRSLKLAQRDDALARGFDLIEWTFDPLEIKNAYLNIARLGAISRRYYRNFYGASSSPLQGGLPTDRIIAEWWIRSPRVEQALQGSLPAFDVLETVTVPSQIYAWKASPEDRKHAAEVQQANASALESAFARGLAVLGYQRTPQGDGIFQLGACPL